MPHVLPPPEPTNQYEDRLRAEEEKKVVGWLKVVILILIVAFIIQL